MCIRDSIRIITSLWPDDFIASAADVEIRFGSKKHVGHKAEQLGPDRLILVGAPKILPKKQGFLDLSDLQNFPFVQTIGTSNTLQYWVKKTKLDVTFKSSVFADSYALAVDFAKHSAGLALVSSLIAAPSLAEGTLRQVHAAAVEPIDGYYLAVDTKSDNQAITYFTQWLKTYINLITT